MILRRLFRSKLLWLLIAGGVFYLGRGFFRAEQFRGPVSRGLERQFARPVTFQDLEYSFLPVPALSLTNVVIGEDPAIGMEPFAYVTALEIVPSLRSVWAGELVIGSVRLVEPSINLARGPSGDWNFQKLLISAVSAEARPRPAPDLEIVDGRINFRIGEVKSLFYLTAADLEVSPGEPAAPGENRWSIFFKAVPARNDRAAQAFGRFTGRGSWTEMPGAGERLDVNIALERSSLGDLITLAYGSDPGIRGAIRCTVNLKGPLSALAVTGEAEVLQIHRWDTLPGKGPEWKLPVTGEIDLIGQRLRLATGGAPEGESGIQLEMAADTFLLGPEWRLGFRAKQLAVDLAAPAAQQLGVPLPSDLPLAGTVDTDLTYLPETGWQGKLLLAGLAVGGDSPEAYRAESAEITISGTQASIPAVLFHAESGSSFRLEGDLDWKSGAADLSLRAEDLPIPALNDATSRWLTGDGMPIVSGAREGRWSGWFRYRKTPPETAAWQGSGVMEDAVFAPAGLAEPLRIKSARLALSEPAVTLSAMDGEYGDLPVRGVYRYQPRAARPHTFALFAASLDADSLRTSLRPILERSGNLIARTLRPDSVAPPDWLKGLRAGGSLQIGSLRLAGLLLQSVDVNVIWNGEEISFDPARARLAGGTLEWNGRIDLRQPSPRYRVSWKLENALWRGALWESEGGIKTSGWGQAAWRNLAGDGAFRGEGAVLFGGREPISLWGCFAAVPGSRGPSVILDCLEASLGGERFTGSGLLTPEGELTLDLRGRGGARRVSGTLPAPQVKEEERP